MRILFWNKGKRDLDNDIIDLVVENGIDLLLLAEYQQSVDVVIENLNYIRNTLFTYREVTLRSTGLKIVCNQVIGPCTPLEESDRYSIIKFNAYSLEFILCLVHLPSKLYAKSSDMLAFNYHLAASISRLEQIHGTKNTIVVGDFNSDPYESSIINASAFNSVLSRSIASKHSRTVQSKSYDYFYNPMWAHYADGTGNSGGTYYYNKGSFEVRYWHIFDQVLLRPTLLGYFDDKSLKILTKNLVDSNGVPLRSKSDHLPISFELNIQGGL